MERVDGICGWVLQRRPWRDSSQLLELFTREHGRVGAIVRGSRRRSGLAPLQRYRLAWQRRGELATLTQWDADGLPVALSGESVLWMWYANELVLRGMQRDDPHPDIFDAYGELLHALLHRGREPQEPPEAPLRRFEWSMLVELGYRPPQPAGDPACWHYDADHGWRAAADGHSHTAVIAALDGHFDTPAACAVGRMLFGALLPQWAGPQPLKTPAMLRALRSRAAQKE